MQKELQMVANYTFIRASQETIDKICQEIGCGIDGIAEVLRNYCGMYVEELRIQEGHNIVPNAIRFSFATLLAGIDVTPTFKANYIALGTGSTTPANTDIQLVSESIRGTLSNRYAIDNVAYLDKFRSSSEVGGTTVSECGIFIDGTGTVNSGFLLSRILMNESMSANETLTINASFTIS